MAEAKTETDAIARSGGTSDTVGQQVAAFQLEAQERFDRAKKNQDLLGALLDIAMPHETKSYEAMESGQVMELAEPSVDEQYTAAFQRRWPDIRFESQAEVAVAARLQEEPEAVLRGRIAGLDAWMLERRRQQRPDAEWRPLLGVVERLDHSEQRRQLRSILINATAPHAGSVVGLLTGRPPWPALWELGRGSVWRRLQQLRSQMNAATEPVLTVLLLAQASDDLGDLENAESALRQALARHPDEAGLLHALGKILERQGSSHLAEAIGCYRAARARHPEFGIALGKALGKAGKWSEGEAILRDLAAPAAKEPRHALQSRHRLV